MVSQAFYSDPSASTTCEDNVFVGYGGEANNPGCLIVNNRMY